MPGPDDPMAILMAKLTGISLAKPRCPITYNVWGKANLELVKRRFINVME